MNEEKSHVYPISVIINGKVIRYKVLYILKLE